MQMATIQDHSSTSMAFPPSFRGGGEAISAENISGQQSLPSQGLSDLRAEMLLRQLQQEKMQEETVNIPMGGQSSMMSSNGAPGYDETELAEQQYMAAQRAIELGVTPAMLEQTQKQMMQQPDMNMVSGDEGVQNKFNTPMLPPFGMYGGGRGGSSQFDGSDPSSSFAQEAAYLQQQQQRLQQQSQQLHNRQVQIMAAAAGLGGPQGFNGAPTIGDGSDNFSSGTGYGNMYGKQPHGFGDVDKYDPSQGPPGMGEDMSAMQYQFPFNVKNSQNKKRAMTSKAKMLHAANSSSNGSAVNNSTGNGFTMPASVSRRRVKTFAEKLMEAIDENSTEEDSIAWLPDGKSFVIVNNKTFIEKTLTTSFKGCKYSSFIRKLHRWGFVRLTSGTGTDCFHHPMFQKGRADLCMLMACTPKSPTPGAFPVGAPVRPTAAFTAKLGNDKPPSLVGIEKFISKAMARKAAKEAAAAETHTEGKETEADKSKEEQGEEQGEEAEQKAIEAKDKESESVGSSSDATN